LNSKSKNQKLVTLLLNWFATNARDLPWRRTRDPYAIWVSEIMLQQTQVKTVIPYWERWMRELPTIESLANASADKIHKLWEGLGYYTRVRNMQKAAQQIVASSRSRRHEEAETTKNANSSALSPRRLQVYQFPQTFDAVLALPGIGRYTAGAICSIAFNQPTPILDGNVIRVLTRIYGINSDPREKQTNAQLWQLAAELVKTASETKTNASRKPRPKSLPLPGERAGVRAVVKTKTPNACSHLNQSLMELGALICTPRSPNCSTCPVQKLCVARKENLQEQLPNLGKRQVAIERRFVAFVIERDSKFLVRQRPAGVVNAHLWEFPNIEVEAHLSSSRKLKTHGKQLNNRNSTNTQTLHFTEPRSKAKELGLKLAAAKPFATIKHSITRYRITLEAWHAKPAAINGATVSAPARSRSAGKSTPDQKSVFLGEWRTLKQLHQLAFTSAHKKILTQLIAPAESDR